MVIVTFVVSTEIVERREMVERKLVTVVTNRTSLLEATRSALSEGAERQDSSPSGEGGGGGGHPKP